MIDLYHAWVDLGGCRHHEKGDIPPSEINAYPLTADLPPLQRLFAFRLFRALDAHRREYARKRQESQDKIRERLTSLQKQGGR